ncbi:MAG: hypothetical protein PWQ57_3129 [Desulfovibrionales bacterium]|jgi:hypothetical protein|nr:hypothetical protein [Desulfovibrionales bacterium]
MDPKEYTLFSGGAGGAEACFGECAEKYGVEEVNFTFEGHKPARLRGLRHLTPEELTKKDVSLVYVSKLLHRSFTNAPFMRSVLQTIMHQVNSGLEVFVVGTLQEDGTVKGGTGWGAEFSKICNKPLFVFDQEKNQWFRWDHEKSAWGPQEAPVISQKHFSGTGTRFLSDNGRKAIEDLFVRSFE